VVKKSKIRLLSCVKKVGRSELHRERLTSVLGLLGKYKKNLHAKLGTWRLKAILAHAAWDLSPKLIFLEKFG